MFFVESGVADSHTVTSTKDRCRSFSYTVQRKKYWAHARNLCVILYLFQNHPLKMTGLKIVM